MNPIYSANIFVLDDKPEAITSLMAISVVKKRNCNFLIVEDFQVFPREGETIRIDDKNYRVETVIIPGTSGPILVVSKVDEKYNFIF